MRWGQYWQPLTIHDPRGAASGVALALPISLLAVFVYQVLKLVYTALVENTMRYWNRGVTVGLGLTLGMTFLRHPLRPDRLFWRALRHRGHPQLVKAFGYGHAA
ncbi:MAG: hypothetical protein ACLR17_10345 [Enterobacteriaceae bacterium]